MIDSQEILMLAKKKSRILEVGLTLGEAIQETRARQGKATQESELAATMHLQDKGESPARLKLGSERPPRIYLARAA